MGARLEERRGETEASLVEQRQRTAKAVAEAEEQAAQEFRRLTEIRERKASALYEETTSVQQRLKEAAEGNKRMLAAEIAEMKLAYKAKVQLAGELRRCNRHRTLYGRKCEAVAKLDGEEGREDAAQL